MSIISALYATAITVIEQLETYADGLGATTARRVTHSGFDVASVALSPATKVASFAQALTVGAATIDLRALPAVGGGTVDGNGLKVQAIRLQAPDTNANVITAGDGASNGYQLGGNGWLFAISPGMEIVVKGADQTPDIAAGAKTIDLAGTGSQVLNVTVVMG